MKQITAVHTSPNPHWVGDGFPVRSLFSYDRLGQELSPFLLLDYAGPRDFAPAAHQRGVGQHPHRGFETVTIVYDGEVAHRDSTGNGGTIGPGDVQWMTAGAGILHEEFHSPDFASRGGPLEMVQLWVNLPAKDKMTAPGYQAIVAADIPAVGLPDGAGQVRVIAGSYDSHRGPARTFSAMDVWDVRLKAGGRARFTLPAGRSLALAVLDGTVLVNGGSVAGERVVRGASVVVFGHEGSDFSLEASADAKLVVLSGEPLDEPIEGYGPFVMNTPQQIREAVADFNSGRLGHMPA